MRERLRSYLHRCFESSPYTRVIWDDVQGGWLVAMIATFSVAVLLPLVLLLGFHLSALPCLRAGTAAYLALGLAFYAVKVRSRLRTGPTWAVAAYMGYFLEGLAMLYVVVVRWDALLTALRAAHR